MNTYLKHLLNTMVILSLITTILISPEYAYADTSIDVEAAYSSRNGMQYAVSSSGLWLNEDGRLKWFGESDYEPSLVHVDSAVSHISSGFGGLVYLTDDSDGQSLHILLADGTEYPHEIRLTSDTNIVQLEGELLVLDEVGHISSVYISDGSLMPISADGWQNENITTFSVWDSYLITYKSSTGELALINNETKTLTFPPITVSSLAWVQVGEVSERAAIAIALDNMGRLLRINLISGSCEIIDAKLPNDCAGLRRNEKYFYTLGNSFSVLYTLPIYQLLEAEESTTLTIVNFSNKDKHFETALALFKEKYPNVNIVTRSVNDYRIVATEIMGGNDGIDLISLQDSAMSTSAALLLKSGALLDLNQFDILTALKTTYRDIFGPVTIGDQWYAVPTCFSQHPWRVNETLAKQIDWNIPAGRWTWDDFETLAKKVKAWNETANTPIYLLQDDNVLLPYFFHEFQANHVNALTGKADYQSDGYIRLLTMWKQLNEDGLLYTSPNVMSKTMQPNVLLYAYRTSLPSMGNNKYIYPPTQTEDSRYPVYAVSCLAINANTPHLEEAVYFLSCYMQPEAASQDYYWNNGQLLNDKTLYDTQQTWGTSISAENENLWNDMMTCSVPELYLYDISRKQYNTLLPGLLKGTVSPEQFAAISQQLADMALGE